jgi:hypothetical protein
MPVVLAGDNVVPTDFDIYSVKSFVKNALLRPAPRAAAPFASPTIRCSRSGAICARDGRVIALADTAAELLLRANDGLALDRDGGLRLPRRYRPHCLAIWRKPRSRIRYRHRVGRSFATHQTFRRGAAARAASPVPAAGICAVGISWMWALWS